jgi:predicted nucleotidyltransferase
MVALRKQVVDEAVRRAAECVHPLRIVLFGSSARGTTDPDSDLDFLVVMPDGSNRLATAQRLYQAMRGLGVATDFVVISQSDLDMLGDNPNLIYHTAITEGIELYHAA